jgi:outer membrane lipoprotein carrier protein
MKKFLCSVSLTALVVTALTAQPKGMGTNDPAAKKILDGVSAKFKSFKSVQAKFSLKIENAAGKNMGTKSGTVYMKGNRYRYTLPGQDVYSDGSNIWTLDKSSKEVTINKLDPSNGSITPQKLITSFYDKDFLYKLNGETRGVQEIELTPIDKSKPYFKLLLSVNKAAQTLSSTKVFMKDGTRTTYSSSGLNTSINIPDDTFVFDIKKFPGVEVVDLR